MKIKVQRIKISEECASVVSTLPLLLLMWTYSISLLPRMIMYIFYNNIANLLDFSIIERRERWFKKRTNFCALHATPSLEFMSIVLQSILLTCLSL